MDKGIDMIRRSINADMRTTEKLTGIDDAVVKYVKHTWKWAKSNMWEPVRNGVLLAFGGNKLATYCAKADQNTLSEIGY